MFSGFGCYVELELAVAENLLLDVAPACRKVDVSLPRKRNSGCCMQQAPPLILTKLHPVT